MAMTIVYNSDIQALYQEFYNIKKVDLIESLAWLIADEKSMGTSKEQGTLIEYLAHFYFEIIRIIHQSNDADWTYLNWLTQDEYDKIKYKHDLIFNDTLGGSDSDISVLTNDDSILTNDDTITTIN